MTTEIQQDSALLFLTCGFVKKQLGKISGHLEGAKYNDDIEDVHQSRVACRRLRAGLRFFGDCFDEKKTQRWKKEIKKLLKSLGTARDLDVQAEFLKNFIKNIPAEKKKYKTGLKRMLLRTAQKRKSIQPKVTTAVQKFQKHEVLKELHIETEKILFDLLNSPEVLQSEEVFSRSFEHIKQNLSAFMEKQDCLENPLDAEGHHKMRIAAKKLRYTLEICEKAYEGRLDGHIKTVKKMQTLLGDVHDCDVWKETIDSFIEKETQRTEDYFGHLRPIRRMMTGIEYLRENRAARRRELFEQARTHFLEMKKGNFAEKLLEAALPEKKTVEDGGEKQDGENESVRKHAG